MSARWRLTLLLLLLLLGMPMAVAVGEEQPATHPAAEDIEFFEKKIRPLLHQRCYSCHSTSSGKRQGGLVVDGRTPLLTGGDSGPALVPAKPDESLLIEAVRYDANSFQMPPTGKLPAHEIALLEEWVRRGAVFPGDEAAVAPRKEIDFAAGKKHWSFQPLRATDPPMLPVAPARHRRIDAFIAAELQQHGLSASPEADRRTLIRRLSFDLIGLPPTPAEVDAFIADNSPDAYERLVERLLSSPHYGERWARLWLDLARYTDATASWLERTAQAYLYRDWVVQAFADDLPYDQFVVRQLATDMLPSTGPQDLAALGFLGLSPTYWKELQLPPEIIRVIVADEWEERIDTVGRTFLGLSIACARCHDHKFDPISTEDYYALAGVFASTRLSERPLVAEGDYAAAAAAKQQVTELQAQLTKLRKAKPPAADLEAQVKTLEAKIAQLENDTPHYHAPLANAVNDESLFVVLKGDDPQSGTRLEYRPGSRDLPVFIRGNPERHGPVVPRRFLQVLSPGEPPPFRQGSGRLELAHCLVNDARPLLARVIVNRIWLAHFGRGLVETPSDFGLQGSRPSHPELLDDLAARFIEHGWSIKWLHREIVESSTYRQSSRATANAQGLDPDNLWFGRMNRRKLDIEWWRDAMLAVSGTLDPTPGGPSTSLDQSGNQRRTLYGTVHRREISSFLSLHDFPDPNAHSPRRLETTTPLQGLYVLNSPLMIAHAKSFAERIARETPTDLSQQIAQAYRLAFGRQPTASELQFGIAFLSEAPPGQLWQYTQALLGSNEFLFID